MWKTFFFNLTLTEFNLIFGKKNVSSIATILIQEKAKKLFSIPNKPNKTGPIHKATNAPRDLMPCAKPKTRPDWVLTFAA